MIPFSVLDLSPIAEGSTPADALRQTLELARHAEALGYNRFWLAEHHNMPGIASAATSVVIGHVAGGTQTIRVGSGGVMLPNHSPLVVAEHFGTLEALYPGRIDLGLGRAPGTDMLTARALRRDLEASARNFPEDVQELRAYLGPADPARRINAVPGAGSNVPIWLLGSSLFSAQLAAMLGLPFAFASHFAPDMLLDAIAVYRRPVPALGELDRPYVMAGAMAAVAGNRRGGALPLHLAAAAVHQPAPRHARTHASAGGKHGRPSGSRTKRRRSSALSDMRWSARPKPSGKGPAASLPLPASTS